jgi:HEAT repeat protein
VNRPRPRRSLWKAAVWAIAGVALVAGAVFIVTRSRPPERPVPAVTRDVAPSLPAEAPVQAKLTEVPADAPAPAGVPEATGTSDPSWASILLDPSRSLKERARAARALAALESEEAFAALMDAFAAAPPLVKAAIAESLGISRHPRALAVMLELLEDPDATVVRGAVRGLAARGGPEASAALTGILNGVVADASIRDEAAVALGRIGGPGTFEALARAALESPGEEVKASALRGLGVLPFAETRAFFEEYLRSTTSAAMKAAALEALGDAEGDPSPLLVEHLSDPSPSVREAALQAMSMTDAPGSAAAELLGRLADEKEPGMRSRIYQALGNQEDFEAETILETVRDEGRPDVRVAGFDLLAGACAGGAAPSVTAFFEESAVPELQIVALTDPDPGNRVAAVIALRKAGTPGARGALETIAREAADPKTAEAARAGKGR